MSMKNLFRNDDFLLTNKYMPNHVSEMILPKRIKNAFLEMVNSGKGQTLLLNGPAGCGKTSAALCIANDLNADVMFVNASLEGNMDLLRNKVSDFASSVSMENSGKKKVIILDEIEGAASPNVQLSLRGITEKFSKNVIFILTTNFKNRLIPPLISRCNVTDFIFDNDEKIEMQAGMFERIISILEQEGIQAEPKVIAQLVKKFFPDFRRLLNELQKYGATGKIDSGILGLVGDVRIDELMELLKNKKFTEMRKWVAQSDVGDVQIFRSIYDTAYDYISPASIPELVLIIAEFQYKAAFCADAEINLTAALTTIMTSCQFK